MLVVAKGAYPASFLSTLDNGHDAAGKNPKLRACRMLRVPDWRLGGWGHLEMMLVVGKGPILKV